jgi:PAS domain S-box-containing protein
MEYYFQLDSAIFFIVGILAFFLCGVIWLRRPAPGASLFSMFMLLWAFWAFLSGLELGAIKYSSRIFWAKMEYVGIVVSGIVWLLFVLDYIGSQRWRRPNHVLPLFIIPLLTLVIVWTNEIHGWNWSKIYSANGLFGPTLIFEHGFWFWIQSAYQYILYFVGIALLWRTGLRKFGNNRTQVIAILIGSIIPLVGSMLYIFDLFPVEGVDVTPLYFVLTGIIYSLTIFKLRFLDIIPIARNALVENLPDGVLVLSGDGAVADINPAAEQMLGLENRTSLGKKLSIVCPKLDVLKSALGGRGHTEVNLGLESNRYMDVSLSPLLDEKKTNNGQLIVLRDITKNRKIEQTLWESEVRYETLVEQSNDGVLIIQDGIYKYANQTMSQITGYPIHELEGRKIPFAVAEEDQQMIEERYALRKGGKEAAQFFEVKLKRKDGEKRDAEISVGSITYEGRVAGMVTIRDVTDRKNTQRKLELLYKEEVKLRSGLQEEINKRSKYTRALVHELRTPLTSILASGELLDSQVQGAAQSAMVRNVRRASQNLEQRINELIELARGETGMLKINPMPTDFAEVVNEITAEMTPIANAKGLSLNVKIGEDIPLVLGDRSRLRQVISNILSNSIKFTFKGGIVVNVRQYAPNFVITQVEDTGRGIGQEEMENLFDPYWRKSSSGQDLGGLGIGLALSKIFVDLHQGKIWAESTPGQGSMFSFIIPIAKDDKGIPMHKDD